MIIRILFLLLLSGLLFSLNLVYATKPKTTVAPFRYAYAYSDCAPWDGPAMRLVLQQKPYDIPEPRIDDPSGDSGLPNEVYPQYSVYIYLERFGTTQPPLNEWIALPEILEDKGVVSFCSQQNQCDRVDAKIRFIRFDKENLYGDVLIDGKTLPFDAPVIFHKALCG